MNDVQGMMHLVVGPVAKVAKECSQMHAAKKATNLVGHAVQEFIGTLSREHGERVGRLFLRSLLRRLFAHK